MCNICTFPVFLENSNCGVFSASRSWIQSLGQQTWNIAECSLLHVVWVLFMCLWIGESKIPPMIVRVSGSLSISPACIACTIACYKRICDINMIELTIVAQIHEDIAIELQWVGLQWNNLQQKVAVLDFVLKQTNKNINI